MLQSSLCGFHIRLCEFCPSLSSSLLVHSLQSLLCLYHLPCGFLLPCGSQPRRRQPEQVGPRVGRCCSSSMGCLTSATNVSARLTAVPKTASAAISRLSDSRSRSRSMNSAHHDCQQAGRAESRVVIPVSRPQLSPGTRRMIGTDVKDVVTDTAARPTGSPADVVASLATPNPLARKRSLLREGSVSSACRCNGGARGSLGASTASGRRAGRSSRHPIRQRSVRASRFLRGQTSATGQPNGTPDEEPISTQGTTASSSSRAVDSLQEASGRCGNVEYLTLANRELHG